MSIRSPYSCFDIFSKLSKTGRFETIELVVKSLDLCEVESFVGLLDCHLEKQTIQRKPEVINDDNCQKINKDVDNVNESKGIRPRLKFYSKSHKESHVKNNVVNQEKDSLSPRVKGNRVTKSSEKMLFSCGNCGESFSSVNSHSIHIKQSKCNEVCDDQVRNRVTKSSEKMLFSCGNCGESFSSVNSHSMHIKQSKCNEVCDDQVRDESKFKKSHNCPKCFRTFSRADKLEAHSVVHTKERTFSCGNCDKTFFSPGSRYNHMKRFHGGEKPFVCDICNKSWAIKMDLVQHRRIHTGEKPHTCPFCQMKFSRSSSLMNHKKVHIQLNSSCTICKKTFFNAKSLYQHNLLHSGKKSYSCEDCGKAFFQKSNLKYHMKTAHLKNNNPFSCVSCEKSFCHARSLNRHNMLHTGEKPYSCQYCGKAYIQNSNLKYHMKTAHIEKTNY